MSILCTPHFSKRGLDRISIFREGLLGMRRGEGEVPVLLKNKLLSEMFNEKKSLSTKIFFSTITKNLNWEILTKNLLDSLQI